MTLYSSRLRSKLIAIIVSIKSAIGIWLWHADAFNFIEARSEQTGHVMGAITAAARSGLAPIEAGIPVGVKVAASVRRGWIALLGIGTEEFVSRC
jgi:hypothetical protein